MRAVGRFVAATVLVGALAAGALYLVLPGNETQADGAADPILGLRKQAMRLLSAVGLAKSGCGLLGGDPWLPSGSFSEWMREGTRDVVAARLSRHAEPVYRGLFWVVGDRITIRMEEFEEPERDVRLMRVGYVSAGRKVIAGEARFEAGVRDRQVTGFVPRDSEGYFAEEVDAAGGIHGVCSWGTAELGRVLDQTR